MSEYNIYILFKKTNSIINFASDDPQSQLTTTKKHT